MEQHMLPLCVLLVKELEDSILRAVYMLDSYTPYHERRYKLGFFMSDIRKKVLTHGKEEKTMEGIFQVQKIHKQGVSLQAFGEGNQMYRINMDSYKLSAVEPGMIIVGTILQDKTCKMVKVERVFPPQAKSFIKI